MCLTNWVSCGLPFAGSLRSVLLTFSSHVTKRRFIFWLDYDVARNWIFRGNVFGQVLSCSWDSVAGLEIKL